MKWVEGKIADGKLLSGLKDTMTKGQVGRTKYASLCIGNINQKLYVIGYLTFLTEEEDCNPAKYTAKKGNANMWDLVPEKRKRIHMAIEALSSKVEERAQETEAIYIDSNGAFFGHRPCESSPQASWFFNNRDPRLKKQSANRIEGRNVLLKARQGTDGNGSNILEQKLVEIAMQGIPRDTLPPRDPRLKDDEKSQSSLSRGAVTTILVPDLNIRVFRPTSVGHEDMVELVMKTIKEHQADILVQVAAVTDHDNRPPKKSDLKEYQLQNESTKDVDPEDDGTKDDDPKKKITKA